ncbi:carbonic anhydrase [Streptomyces fildesensis]|uniref:carbonic anhydrase n=1 Tax=Streptomyces fildesensis TaxID=375757 RepID=A0ABW8CAG4_9ACTN
MNSIDGLLSRRAALGVALTALPPKPELPGTGVAIVTGSDARPGVETMFGLRPGDAHVIRNAGGCVNDDTLHSLRLSQTVGGTSEILLVHHEDCAALGDPADDLRACLIRLRDNQELPHTDVVRGFVYTRGGALREIRPERAEN